MLDRLKGGLYRAAWRVVPKLPQAVVLSVAHFVADVVFLMDGSSVRQMERNFRQLTGKPVSRKQLRAGVRSYFRCFAQQFTMPGWTSDQIARACIWPDAQRDAEWMERDQGPVVLALTHSGNWDLAGAWFCQNWAPIVTVAEKLEPEDLFDQFVDFRRSLGMEIIGVAPGEHVFGELVKQTGGRPILVPLLADRDISGAGVEVQLGASKALVAAGPAALALRLGRPLIAGHISYRQVHSKGPGRGKEWRIVAHFSDPIAVPEAGPGETQIEALTRAWVAEIAPVMQEHMVDWHMMQKVFVDDLDPERLRRARQRALDRAESESQPLSSPGDKQVDS